MTKYVAALAIGFGMSVGAFSAFAGGGCVKDQMTVQSSTPSTVVDGAQTVPMTPIPPVAPSTGG